MSREAVSRIWYFFLQVLCLKSLNVVDLEVEWNRTELQGQDTREICVRMREGRKNDYKRSGALVLERLTLRGLSLTSSAKPRARMTP